MVTLQEDKDQASKVLILGGDGGLLGSALVCVFKADGWKVDATKRKDFDHLDPVRLKEVISASKPDLIINTIAYTQVDQAEDEPQQADKVNRILPLTLGEIVKKLGIKLIHYSTDFVFSGSKKKPYLTTDEPSSESVYGKTKLDGEKTLLALDSKDICIIRTAWLFGPSKKNFVATILKLCETKKELNVVFDQIGSPTYTVDLAEYSLALAKKLMLGQASGIYHIVNSGQASWCELAAEAVRLSQSDCRILAISSDQYPQKAKRPPYSVLDTSRFTELTGVTPRPWLKGLSDFLYREDKNQVCK
ncbi:dTDP-4-dehydrorhamnose reductase [Desulfovibrio litoralis]|uniref:dTDP-4-dehydrorhamnose reductase n=1 Tax=Desulfovibrio litoralis DSM 11393 TaxID=1121455 RepID=A0A1M7S6L4_9BACT|nr:dTDP-4-dehydrorhamnose reductase [Desulfovibrio litoralis]SHN54287.1 dTDP-4-dehydrorhamnose reductase [Desulfovibrio litoralis DSM 11393]